MTIWEYALETTDVQDIAMPRGAQVLSVQVQRGVPCLWALVEESAAKVQRGLRIYGTGHPIDEPWLSFIGSYQLAGGDLVFHVFDMGER